ncbi:hypothetical protein Y1Q_0009094 [Alligator mississippiensis]|uniref:Uncharacterized protein n=1 Tax=Alligator mississippiensis TaxID=8496 RepID=A0A151M298_ALLMI|nr:hypothetical protein Y1Q_0009094 [Alligator mississippiensis]
MDRVNAYLDPSLLDFIKDSKERFMGPREIISFSKMVSGISSAIARGKQGFSSALSFMLFMYMGDTESERSLINNLKNKRDKNQGAHNSHNCPVWLGQQDV